MLLEKVVRGGKKEKERAQYLYSHSTWLVNFIESIVTDRPDILAMSRKSKYFRKQESKKEE